MEWASGCYCNKYVHGEGFPTPTTPIYVATLPIERLPRSLCRAFRAFRVEAVVMYRARSGVLRMSAHEIPLEHTVSLHISQSLCRDLASQVGRYRRFVRILSDQPDQTPEPDATAPPLLTPSSSTPTNQALSCCLPLVFLLWSILRPVLVRMRLRNPCLRMRISRDGRFMFMYRRGPQRICEPTPASAGCDVIAVLGTTSAIADDPPPTAASAPTAVGPIVVAALGARSPTVGLLVKMLGGADMPGRRIGREEKDLVMWHDLSVRDSTLGKGQGHIERTSSELVVL